MSDHAEVSELRDALDHIWRVARASRTESRRDRWIAARALSALEGNDNWQEADYPKVNVPKNVDRIRVLGQERDSLKAEVEQLRLLVFSPEKIPE